MFEKEKKFYQYEINANAAEIGKFQISDLIELKAKNPKTGTVVEISNLYENAISFFMKTNSSDISSIFAAYLNKYRDINVTYKDEKLDVHKHILRTSNQKIGPIKLAGGKVVKAELEILEWINLDTRALYLCDENGFTLAERSPDIRAPGYHFGAYLKSSHFAELQSGSIIEMDMEEGFNKLVGEARAKISEYFKQIDKEKALNLIDEWKRENIYPYEDDEVSEISKQSRRIFNMCAVTIHTQVKGFASQDKVTKSLSFRLLREAIEERPSEVSRILSEVLNLSNDKQKQFATLLEKSKLSDIIDTVSLIQHRLNTAYGLRSLVCSDKTKATVKERQHIHQVVERNPWMFGEEFALGISESSLTNALREHLKRLGIDQKVTESVLLPEKKNARIDIMLCQSNKISGRNDDHHLIIELKRASKILGYAEYSQVFKYATAVMNDGRFKKTEVKWSFWLVGVELSPDLEEMANSQDRPSGCAHIFKEGNGKIWVKTWGQVLHECISRHEFIRGKLDLEITEEGSISYLNEIYPLFVPDRPG